MRVAWPKKKVFVKTTTTTTTNNPLLLPLATAFLPRFAGKLVENLVYTCCLRFVYT